MKKIIHIIPDNKVFVNLIIRLFNANKNIDNTFIIESNKKLKNDIKQNDVFYKTSGALLDDNFINKEIKSKDILLIHSLDTKYKAKLITKVNFDIKIIWASWGADFYQHHPRLRAQLLEKKTKKLKKKLEPFIKEKIARPILNIIYPQFFPYYWQKKAVKKIDYIAPVIYEDYELIKKYYNAPHLKFINFSYGYLEGNILAGINLNNISLGNNILFGNSSSFTNNHIEAIDILSKIDLESRKIITPLSYGNVKLKDYLVKYGKEKLRDNYHPLVNFMSREKYHNLLLSCGYYIMNHKRQQAMGVINTGLYLGAKVFFNKKNPAYNYFKRLGANVYLIDEIIEKKEEAFTPLTPEQIQKNRDVLIQNRSKKVVESYIQKIAEL